MSDLLRWFVCLAIGHVYSGWTPAVWVYDDVSGRESAPRFTSNVPREIRFCLRCSNGLQSRFVT